MRHASRLPKVALALFASASVLSCASHPPSRPATSTTPPSSVTQYGGMRAVMREGQTEPRIALTEVTATPHAIAVGALAGLAGEVTVIDGAVWTARRGATVEEVIVSTPDTPTTDAATLLTVAHVPAWREVVIDASAEGEALDALIARIARDANIDTSRPFPLMIMGTCEAIEIHVVHNFCPHGETPGTADALPWHFASEHPEPVTIAGFYAPNAAGVMTHHGSSTHLHAVLEVNGNPVTGHVDRLRVGPGMVVRLPAS